MSTNLRNIDAFVALSPASVTYVRKITGFALTTVPEPVTLRKVSGYALIDVVKLPNFSLSGAVVLLAAINKEKNVNFTANQLTFGVPQVVADATQYFNTTILVTAKKVSNYSGSYTFQYRRFTLDVGFNGQTLDLPAGMGSTIHASLGVINAKFGVKLETTDVVDGPVVNGATSVTLTVKDSSILYIPDSKVTLGTPDTDIPFATVAPVTDALGFDPA